MNIRIDEKGALYIMRGGSEKQQQCPFDTSYAITRKPQACGDWCALFGEPEERRIVLCRATLCGTIIDDRYTEERHE